MPVDPAQKATEIIKEDKKEAPQTEEEDKAGEASQDEAADDKDAPAGTAAKKRKNKKSKRKAKQPALDLTAQDFVPTLSMSKDPVSEPNAKPVKSESTAEESKEGNKVELPAKSANTSGQEEEKKKSKRRNKVKIADPPATTATPAASTIK